MTNKKIALITLVIGVLALISMWIIPKIFSGNNSKQETIGFRVSGGQNIMKGNMAVNNTVAFDIKGGNNVLEDNLSVGIIEGQQNVSQIKSILDKNLLTLEQSINQESMFDRASLYEAAAKKYAVFGIWEKAIEYAYKAISFQLKVSKKDPSEILKSNDFFRTTEFQESFISSICSHLYFIAKKLEANQIKIILIS